MLSTGDFDSGRLLSILTLSAEPTAIYTGPELIILYANEGMLNLFGKQQDIVGKKLLDILPELANQPFIKSLREIWDTGKMYTATDTPASLLINGELKKIEFSCRTVYGPDGRIEAILHTARDVDSHLAAGQQIAEKKEQEKQMITQLSMRGSEMQAANQNPSSANAELLTSNDNINRLNVRLQESETDFKRLVEQAPVAILVFRGPDMVIDLVNEAMLNILGKDSSVIGKPLLEGLPEIKGAPAVDQLFEVFHTGKPFDGNEAPVPIKRNGKLENRYFNFTYRALLDNGQIIGVMDVAIEVTEQVMARKRLEAIITEKTGMELELRANERRLQSILDTMAEGVVIVTTTGIPTYANPMAQRIMGIDEVEFKKRVYNDFKWRNERLDGTPLPIEEHPMYTVIRTGMPVFDQEIVIIIPSKEKLYISVNAAPLTNELHEITGAIITFTDVSNRRKVLQQKDEFISVASHELKTPVTSLKASLQLLERMQGDIKPEMLFKLVSQANKSLNKLSDLVNSLLNSNRISQGRFPLKKTTFALADMLNGCCQHVRTEGIYHLRLQGDEKLRITADEQLIDQVVVNMVNNAIKYAPDSKEIVISAEKLGNMTRIAVTDKGPGIPPDKASHIFERYYQAEHGGLQFSGLGLGLYIASEIIHKHGGEIGVESTLGQGSTFWFTIPG